MASRAFGKQVAARPHLAKGEVLDLRRDVEAAFSFLETSSQAANLAALGAMGADLGQGARVLVLTHDQPWELDKTSTATPDASTVIAAAGGGRWLRLEAPSKKWSLAYLAGAYIDPYAGNDENPGTALLPTKTISEIMRRLHQAQAGQNYQINIVDTSPSHDGVPATDRFRPCFIAESDVEQVQGNGNEQIFNFTLIGRTRVLASGVVAGYATTAAGDQAKLTDTTLGTAGLSANVGNMLVLTSGASVGATAAIGATNTQDAALAANVARVSPFVLTATNTLVSPANGTTYDVVANTLFAPSILQLGSAGRYVLKNIEVTPVSAPPADQGNISLRYDSVNCINVKFRRSVDVSFGLISCQGCIFADGPGNGSGTAVVQSCTRATAAFLNTLFLNINVQWVLDSAVSVSNLYLEKSMMQTRVTTSFVANIASPIVDGFASGGNIMVAGPLAIYNWPVGAKAGLRIGSNGFVKAAADILGAAQNANQVGILIEDCSQMTVLDTVTPTIGTGVGGTVVADDQINIDNPGTATKVAVAQVPYPLTGSPPIATTLTADVLRTFAHWTAAPFSRHAFNLSNGARLTSYPAP